MTVRKWGAEQTIAGANAIGQTAFSHELDVCVLADGSYVIGWITPDGLSLIAKAQHFDATGKALGDAFQIGEGATSGKITEISLAALGGGGFAAAFTVDDQLGNSWYQRFDAGMNSAQMVQWDNISNSAGEDNHAIAATSDGGFLIAETDRGGGGGEIWLQKRDAGGDIVQFNGGNFLNVTAQAANLQYAPHIAVLEDDKFVVSWTDTSLGVRYQIFKADGSVFSAPKTLVNRITVTDGAVIQALPGGGFAMVWRDTVVAGDPDWGIQAQVFDKNGTATSNIVLVNTLTDGLQVRPDVTAGPNGGFLVTWQDPSAGGNDIAGQLFDASGNKVGTQFQINTSNATAAYNAHVDVLADGRIVAAWASVLDSVVRHQIIDPRDGLVDGTAEADTLYGHDALADEVSGFGGNDTLIGLAGNDQISGGDGEDTINGGDGDDVVFGGKGNDKVSGGFGNDQLNGEDGADVLTGHVGNDRLNGGDGDDLLRGGLGADVHDGGNGIDTASYAKAGKGVTVSLDTSLVYTGEAAGDTFKAVENLTGSRFADTLRGNAGVNAVSGGAGADHIEGRGGQDALTGGNGNDSFSFRAVSEAGDTVTDFSNVAGNDDHFEFKGSSFGNLAAGALDEARFQSSADDVAATKAVRFIYETDTGNLYFDRDGSGATYANVLVATVQAGALVDFQDFVVV